MNPMRTWFRLSISTVFVIAFFQTSFVLAQSRSSAAQSIAGNWPGKKAAWNGFVRFDFEIDQRPCYVVLPASPAPGNPWVWRARFPDFHHETDLILLNRGFVIARMDTDGMLGSPRAMNSWDKFYHFLVQRGLAKQCALEGVSRGGLFVYGFAARWPQRVACIYCDTPVCDLRSWPGGKGKGRGHAATWQICLQEYGLTESSVVNFKSNPVDRLAPIAAENIPILHIVSLNDEIVPPDENTFVLAKRFRQLGGRIDILEVKQGTESSGGHHFTHPDPMQVADFIEQHASVLPNKDDYFMLRGRLDNCRIKFETTGTGRVVFLGGSITAMKGWRDEVAQYLRQKFPQTEFEFINAGIPSTGTTPGAFRLIRDVFSNGDVDLLFEEAAVNDLHNQRTPTEMVRGMEGILRHARLVNPSLDIVVMHFVDPQHMKDYRAGSTPMVIAQHEHVASHHNIPTINLAKEITERIDDGQLDWENDFQNCHPSPYGHRIYSSTIRRFFSSAWSNRPNAIVQPQKHVAKQPLDPFSYDRSKMVPLSSASDLVGFRIVPVCDPRDNQVGGAIRERFFNVPMLVGTTPGSTFKLKFSGRAVGLFVAAGPDAGIVEYSIDGGAFQSRDLFTKWSQRLHLPWAYVLADELEPGPHELIVRIAPSQNPNSTGNACRIVDLLVNP